MLTKITNNLKNPYFNFQQLLGRVSSVSYQTLMMQIKGQVLQ